MLGADMYDLILTRVALANSARKTHLLSDAGFGLFGPLSSNLKKVARKDRRSGIISNASGIRNGATSHHAKAG